MRPCRECGKPIADNVSRCPHCGRAYTTRGTKIAAWLVAIFIALLLLAKIAKDLHDN